MPAYMEEVDDEDHIQEGTKVAASVAASPTKERANSKKTRRSSSISPPSYGHTDSDETILSPRRRDRDPRSKAKERERLEREREKERERAHQRNPTKKNVAIRPTPKSSKTAPVVHTYPKKTPESEYYGVQGSNSSQRFRSHTATNYGGGVPITGGSGARSMSYHGPKSHPPPANAGFYASQQFSTSPFTPSLSGYPPPQQPFGSSYGSSYGGGHPPAIAASHSPLPPPSPVDSYMDAHHHDHLKQRFQPSRPASAIGIRQTRRPSYYDDHEDEDDVPRIGRKPSIKAGGKDRDLHDRVAMPPPPRPKSTRPIVLRPPPPQTHKTRGYDDESFIGEGIMYRDTGRDIPPRDIPRDLARRSGDFSTSQPRQRRMSMIPGDSSLQLQGSREVRSRPNSIYGGVDDLDYEYGYSDKVQEQLMKAGAYQDSVAGGVAQALTKDALQKATKRSQGGSSRSTRSSSSHDESEWRHSATTRTTRSIVGDEDVTIKVRGHAVVEVSGTKIECQDGSAISISSRPAQSQSRMIESDKGSTVYDDRKTRIERLPHRSRAMSQSNYTRNHPVYESYDGDYDRYW